MTNIVWECGAGQCERNERHSRRVERARWMTMASRVQRLFSTLRALRHDNPLVYYNMQFSMSRSNSLFTGPSEAW